MTDHTARRDTPADLPLILEQLQGQLDDLIATVGAQQEQIARQAARITALEQS